MANGRGQYGTHIGAEGHHGPSLVKWLVGGLVIGGTVLWAKRQSDQIARLSAAAGLPQPSFTADVRDRAKALASSARAGIHKLTRPRLSEAPTPPKET